MTNPYAYSGEWVLSSILEDQAAKLGDRVFAITDEGSLTFGDLRRRAASVAGSLSDLGVEPGDRVATMLPPSLDYLAVWFGIAWAGAVDVPVNTEYKGEFLRHQLRDCGARVLVVSQGLVSRLKGLELPELQQVVVAGDSVTDVPHDYSRFRLQEMLTHTPVERTPRSETDLLYIMYTSGTTGPSKGVMLSNRAALWNAYSWLEIVELDHSDVAYSMFPLFHVTARSAVVTSSLWAGSQVVLRKGFSASRFWKDVRAVKATWFGYMGAVIHLLYSQPVRDDDADNPVIRAFGAAAPPGIIEDFERRFGLRLIEVYGSTELGPATAPLGGRKVGTQGRPLPHVILEIHDESDRPLPPGREGEIVVRPAVPHGIFQGYWGLPAQTLEAFRNLWFHTGDGGKLDEDGYLTFTDRIKDSIRRRGENISSFEVERAVQAHPTVLECGAYGVPSELSEDEVMIAVVPVPGARIDPVELFSFCIEQLPRFAVPRYLRVVESLPKTPSQRIQKFKLRAEGVTADTYDREAMSIEVPRE